MGRRVDFISFVVEFLDLQNCIEEPDRSRLVRRIDEVVRKHLVNSRSLTVDILGEGDNGIAGQLVRTIDEETAEFVALPPVVIKLTADETEVRAGIALDGKQFSNVVHVYGSWFLRDVTLPSATCDIGPRVGMLLTEPLVPARTIRNTVVRNALDQLGVVVRQVKNESDVWPHTLRRRSRSDASVMLCDAMKLLEARLATDRYIASSLCRDVVHGLHELRSEGICLVDVHGRNIGWDSRSNMFKILDVGASSTSSRINETYPSGIVLPRITAQELR